MDKIKASFKKELEEVLWIEKVRFKNQGGIWEATVTTTINKWDIDYINAFERHCFSALFGERVKTSKVFLNEENQKAVSKIMLINLQ